MPELDTAAPAPKKARRTQRLLTRTLHAREDQALALRVAGADYATIMQQCGYAHVSSTVRAVTAAIARVPAANVETLRIVEGARLDRLQVALWPKAAAGDLETIDRVLRIMARRARLFGLDAPQTFNVHETIRELANKAAAQNGMNPDEIVALAEAYLHSALS